MGQGKDVRVGEGVELGRGPLACLWSFYFFSFLPELLSAYRYIGEGIAASVSY